MDLNNDHYYWLGIQNRYRDICNQSVVDKVEDNLQDAAEDGGQGDPQVDIIGVGVGLVFFLLCPGKSDQERMS